MLESFSKKIFVKKFGKTFKILNEKVDSYLDIQDEKNIHDLRIAIRRFNSAFALLPKKIRKNSRTLNYLSLCKNLFKVNTEIRDYDIICKKLEKYSNNPISLGSISSLKQNRSLKIEEAKKAAIKLQKFKLPTSQVNFSKQKLQKRFYNVISKLDRRIEITLPVAIGDEKKIDELHRLRKDFKKMRYTLELAGKNKRISKFIDNLKNIQDVLGEIHDSDIMINYLKDIKTSDVGGVMASEMEIRHKKYDLFVASLKRKDTIAVS